MISLRISLSCALRSHEEDYPGRKVICGNKIQNELILDPPDALHGEAREACVARTLAQFETTLRQLLEDACHLNTLSIG